MAFLLSPEYKIKVPELTLDKSLPASPGIKDPAYKCLQIFVHLACRREDKTLRKQNYNCDYLMKPSIVRHKRNSCRYQSRG